MVNEFDGFFSRNRVTLHNSIIQSLHEVLHTTTNLTTCQQDDKGSIIIRRDPCLFVGHDGLM